MLELHITSSNPIVDFEVQLSTHYDVQGERGVGWGRSLLLAGHICICVLISMTGFLISKGKGRVFREGGMKGWELRKDISWSLPELTLTHLHSWL
jgi:hypothetical protein